MESPSPLTWVKGYALRLAFVGGNWNNDLNCGPFYANLYNSASNSNSNNGAALPYLYLRFLLKDSVTFNATHIAVERSKGEVT